MTDQTEGLKALREPFPANQVGKLPKGGTFLDFVGHGYLTARMLDVDENWTWEPFALNANGLPLLDDHGGMWIKLTICGMTRIGYGDAGGRTGPNAIKEAIGDALRNAGMRFGLALDLWCKGDPDATPPPPPPDPDLELALAELGDACAALKLDAHKTAGQFLSQYRKPARQARPKQIRDFIVKLHETAEKAAQE